MVLRRARPLVVVLLGACALAYGAGCGSGLTPGDGYDQSLFTFWGNLPSTVGLPAEMNPKVGVLWSDPLQVGPDVPMPPSWHTVVVAPDVNGNFRIDFYRPPPPAAIRRIVAPSGPDFAELAIADVVLFDDRTNDDAFRTTGPHAEMASDDGYLAGSTALLVYVARPFSQPVPPGFPLADGLGRGYALIEPRCNGQVSLGPLQTNGTFFIPQPSQRLPELRGCRRTHSP